MEPCNIRYGTEHGELEAFLSPHRPVQEKCQHEEVRRAAVHSNVATPHGQWPLPHPIHSVTGLKGLLLVPLSSFPL